jgi:transglutaminase-like putative cysteine protease
MQFDKSRFSVLLIILLELVFTSSLHAQGYRIEPVPDWVKSVQPLPDDQADQQNNSNGVSYLLVDEQWQIREGRQSHYAHIVDKALNSSGVEEVSQISIDFDPAYQSLILHQIRIHRDDRILDRINRSQIDLIQREKELDYQVYDGSKTLNVFIEDVRPGDNMEYSYTIEGANPVFSGHFSEHLDMRWGVPVGRVHYRVLWPSSRPLHIRNHETGIEPVKRTSGQNTEYVWNEDRIESLVSDKEVPDWYDPFPVVYLSDMASWGEVGAWAWPLYKPVINTPALQAVTAPILKTTNTVEQRVLAALHFVQDEVRYLGIEMGARSHEPNAPDAVIRQRFGDCKDKSRLLVSLLQGMGVEASPALVNTDSGMLLKDALPSPTEFDHTIVLARVNGRNYWLDPTRSHQGGSLDAIYQPDYDYALVVSDHDPDLVKMSDDINTVHGKTVEETFDIRDGFDKPVNYRIVTQHVGYYADSLREQLAEMNPYRIAQSFLNYTAHYYPDVRIADSLGIDDDDKLNRITLTEHYAIPDIWTKSDDERYIIADFQPYLINDYIKEVSAPIRTMPYAVTHPVRYQQTTRILLPEGSSFEKEFDEIEDKAFRFTRRVDFSDNALVLDYLYESLADHVNPGDIKAYSKNVRAVQNLAAYRIHAPDPARKFGEFRFDAGDINWLMVIIIVLAFAGAGLLSYKYLYLYDPPCPPADHPDTRLEGLGGWLILPGIAIITSPVRILIETRDIWYLISAWQWSIIADRLETGLLATMVVEMICNVALIMIALFLIVMFFTRRHTFPRFFIAYFVFSLVVTGGDLLALHLLSYPGVEVDAPDLGELARLAVYTVIWTLYFMKSKRVKATFTRRRKNNTPLQGEENPGRDVIPQEAG